MNQTLELKKKKNLIRCGENRGGGAVKAVK